MSTQPKAFAPSLETSSSQSGPGPSIGQYLIRRLLDHGVHDLFGIPGDYVLSFYTLLEQSDIRVIGTTREDCAGFAADAYARIHGMGALCITYCVGGMSVCNSVAGAFAEKSPVLVISGSPGMSERINNPLLHHKVRDFRTQLEVFERLCLAGAELTDPATAFREIDRVLNTVMRYKRPCYLEIPRDMVHVVPHTSYTYQETPLESNPDALREAVEEAASLIACASRPVILAGVEIHRFGLQDQLLALAEKSKIPIAATLLGKSVIRETHPLYVGLYEGAMGRQNVTRYVEESDCLILLGTFMTDINLGIYTAQLNPANCVYVTSEQLRIRHHHYHGVLLGDFVERLTEHVDEGTDPADLPQRVSCVGDSQDKEEPISIRGLTTQLNELLDENTIVIADIGDSLFAATELEVHGRTEFLSPAYYTSMGFSVPAALGALVARPESRVVVLCGDGAFQMTGMELSTIVRQGYSPIVVVLDNGGYGTERALHEGDWKFNEIHGWHYSKLPEVLGGGQGFEISTWGELESALAQVWDNDTHGMSLLHVHIHPDDQSPALRRLADRMRHHV